MGQGRSEGQSLKTEDGEIVEGVKSITWKAEAVERPILMVEFYPERLEFDLGGDPPAEPDPA